MGVVTPWNYPLLMAAWKIAPILAAGNTLVIKPSELTPLTTLKFAEHPGVAMIALTGSVRSGRAVARAAVESLKRVHLELGGKAPVVVFGDADLPAAASALRAVRLETAHRPGLPATAWGTAGFSGLTGGLPAGGGVRRAS